jgi:predicted molibdopterin-dependent oxidoreductase YjgC
LRVRKAWFKNGATVIVASDKPTDADSFASVVLRYKPGSEAALAEGLRALAAGGANVSKIAEETGVAESVLRDAAGHLAGAAVITTHSLLNTPNPEASLKTLGELGGSVNCYALGANDQGALDMGIVPFSGTGEKGLGTHEILQGCADGTIKALWLVDCDPFELHHDKELVQKALEQVHFLVVQQNRPNGATPYASVVLPQTAPAEQDGTLTNMERRVQRMPQVLAAHGVAKPAWRIFSEVSMRIKPETPPFGPSDAMEEIGREIPAYAVASYANLEGEGVLIR